MTMFAALIFLAAQGATAPATPPARVDTTKIDPKVAAQVPIISEKLNHWRGAWGVVGGKLGCETMRSSGDKEIDALGCASVLACVRPAYPELKKIKESKVAIEERKRRMAAKLASLEPCMKQHRGQGIAEIALRRGRG